MKIHPLDLICNAKYKILKGELYHAIFIQKFQKMNQKVGGQAGFPTHLHLMNIQS